MSGKTGNIILIGMIVGTVIGVLGGLYAGELFLSLAVLGTAFLNALKAIVVPLVVVSIVVGVATLGDIRSLGRTSVKTLGYYLATTGLSVIVGLILVNVIRPGVGIDALGAHVPDMVAQSQGKTLADVLLGLVPANIFRSMVEGDILPLIVASLVFGGVLSTVGEIGKPVVAVFEGINEVMMRVVHIVIMFAPLGVMALIGGIVAEQRDTLEQLFTGMAAYALTVVVGLLIHGAITLPLLLHLFAKRSPIRYALNMGQALTTAFTTASSTATLPLTIESVTEINKVDKRAASFVLPLGATINMDGTALYEAVAAMFIAQIYGVDLGLGQQVVIFLTATLVSIGAAGIPHAGTVMMVIVLNAVGLPLEGIGLIWAIDWFLDRCRTTVNVWGDAVGAAIIGNTAEFRQDHSS